MQNNQLTVQRMLNAPVESVYRAFADPVALVKWLPPRGYIMRVVEFDLRNDGMYHFELTHFMTKQQHSLKGQFIEVCPQQKVRYIDHSHDNIGIAVEKILHFNANFMGTEFKVTQKGLQEQRPAEMYYVDWQDSLYLLSLLLEH